ncbi:F5/8 type C domain-containing protein [Paenibacillus sp. ov031]|uniref:discoidin domain-containing protein n=1 Tax=Paenibacillus sp. ov031 TaxID=1761879 RepID=UPI0009168FC1|nr:discoidin domain-containing protein [Paenibacillus sp. ov031]SHN71825.1 F5/8 type C domain-containing protein [Paenibacillus sp. ov031]
MPAPATTGQLRSNIRDMEVGDYISCSALRSSGLSASFAYDIGYPRTDEIPFTGFNSISGQSGGFYFVKVDKGLLISDRVIFNSVTWDALNAGKLIEGTSWDSFGLTPTMTSNTAPYGVASASSEINNNRLAFQAFDKANGNKFWQANARQGWIQYRFSEGRVVTKYIITGVDTAQLTAQVNPKSWTFEGSNDGTRWEVLDNRVDETLNSSLEKKTYVINNKQSYICYRLNITLNHGHTDYVALSELELKDAVEGRFRSLSGGVAYADVNGEKLLSGDLGNGAWPIVNEWDKYIVNFPLNKIQVGKTLDDVFNWSVGVSTWCKDTPVTGLAAIDGSASSATSSSRMRRGKIQSSAIQATLKRVGYSATSSTANAEIGFRPVFEYREV